MAEKKGKKENGSSIDKMEDMAFEDAVEQLEKCAQKISSDDITLADAIKSYEDGMMYYQKCRSILDDAKQKIEFYSNS